MNLINASTDLSPIITSPSKPDLFGSRHPAWLLYNPTAKAFAFQLENLPFVIRKTNTPGKHFQADLDQGIYVPQFYAPDLKLEQLMFPAHILMNNAFWIEKQTSVKSWIDWIAINII